MNRREFMKRASAAGMVGALSGPGMAATNAPAREARPDAHAALAGEVEKRNEQGMPLRRLGATDEWVSIMCLGGHTMGTAPSEKEGIALVREAVALGVTFMDNCWEYHDGKSEEWMGKALEGGLRDDVFLMTKVCTHGRGRDVAMQQLEQSLKRLQTDHLDLWQIHEVVYENDPELHFKTDGVVDALEQAMKEGKTRYVGFTGHKNPDIHLQMLQRNFGFHACQLPLNVFDGTFRSFEQRVLPELNRRGIAPLAMKSLNGTAESLKNGVLTIEEALRYVLSLPIATLVTGVENTKKLQENAAIARAFQPYSAEEMASLRSRLAPVAADGRFELYKTSKRFDGKPGREQHGFPSESELPL